MIFRCRDLAMNIFEFHSYTVSEAIKTIEDYEKKNQTAVRAFEKDTNCRIVGGILQKTN
jgi:hypothetical protein